jgi:methionyl aminopeptidase
VIHLKSAGEIEVIGRAGAIVADVLERLRDEVRPSVSTAGLDRLAEEMLRSFRGAEPAFKGLYGFPASLCTSINEEVVHGIPSERRILEDGDIISLDLGVRLEGYYADSAVTLAVGEISPQAEHLLAITESALEAGIAETRSGGHLGDIGEAIQTTVEAEGYSVVRELVGHGVGHAAHEDPQVPNYGRAGHGRRLREGLVIAIEPMVNVGGASIRTLSDGWTVVSADGSLSAHFEHTVAVTSEGPRILTAPPVRTAVQGGDQIG